jgi:hypothetical protein
VFPKSLSFIIAVFIPAFIVLLSGCRVNKPVSTAFTRSTIGIGTRTPAKSIRVFMDADTIQKKSAAGLQFSLKLQNDSAIAVEIVNPLDLLSVAMFDTAWKEVHFPYRGRQRGHDRGWTNKTFVVGSVIINGRSIDVKPFIEGYNITIPANGKVEIFMKITHVLKPGAVEPLTVEQTIPVPTGVYKVNLTSGLMEGHSSVILHMPLVNIHYQ